MANVIIAIDNDEESRKWAQFVQLNCPVLTGTEEMATDLINRYRNHLHAILINTQNYQSGFFLAALAARAGRHTMYVAGVVSPTLPDALSKSLFVIEGIPVTLNKLDRFLIEDRVTDWVMLYRSLTFQGSPEALKEWEG